MIKGLSKKILICILVFIIIFNFWITSVTYADGKTVEEVEESHNQQMEANETGLAGIISLIFRLPIIITISPSRRCHFGTYYPQRSYAGGGGRLCPVPLHPKPC